MNHFETHTPSSERRPRNDHPIRFSDHRAEMLSDLQEQLRNIGEEIAAIEERLGKESLLGVAARIVRGEALADRLNLLYKQRQTLMRQGADMEGGHSTLNS